MNFTKTTELWTRIRAKAKEEGSSLTDEEKELIIERIIDGMQVDLWHSTDESLLEILIEKGYAT